MIFSVHVEVKRRKSPKFLEAKGVQDNPPPLAFKTINWGGNRWVRKGTYRGRGIRGS